MKKAIFVTTSFIGYHKYPEAPEDVVFLRELHRHKFNVKVTIEVFGADREIEFFILKSKIDCFIGSNFAHSKSTLSCEQMASKIYNNVKEIFHNEGRRVEVVVDEDGENGAIVGGV